MKEMVGGCCVCSDDRGWTENPLVYCDGPGCSVAVHQACYGIVTVPLGNWYCRKCESADENTKVRCELCPNRDGALKPTGNSSWAHVVCALYIPEVRFGNVTTMEPIILSQIPPERFNKACYLCEEGARGTSRSSVGACMQCNKAGCKAQFHVTCAQSRGLLCEEAGNYMDNVKYCGYCHHHYTKLVIKKKGVNVKVIPPYKPAAVGSPEHLGFKESDSMKTTKRKLSTSSAKSSSGRTTSTSSASSAGLEETPGKSSLDDGSDAIGNPPPILVPDQKSPGATPLALAAEVKKRRKGESRTPPVTGLTPDGSPRPITPLGGGSSSAGAPSSGSTGSSLNALAGMTSMGMVPPPASSPSSLSGSMNQNQPPGSSSSPGGHEPKRPLLQAVLKDNMRPNSIVVNVPLEVLPPGSQGSMSNPVTPTSNPSATLGLPTVSGGGSTTLPQVDLTNSSSLLSGVSSLSSGAPLKRARSQSSEKTDKPRRSSKRGSGGGGSSSSNKSHSGSSPTNTPNMPNIQSSNKNDGLTNHQASQGHLVGAVLNHLSSSEVSQHGASTSKTRRHSSSSHGSTNHASTSHSLTNHGSTSHSAPTNHISHTSTNHLSHQQPGGSASSTPAGHPPALHINHIPTAPSSPLTMIKDEKTDVKLLSGVAGVQAPHMLGNSLNPSSSMAQKMCDTLSQEMVAHSVFSTEPLPSNHQIGPPIPGRTGPSIPGTTNNHNTSGSWGGTTSMPQSLEQLLERQWEQGSQFLMEQAQHFDIASLLTCLHQLRAENNSLEEQVTQLIQRRDHLLAVNARLAIPLVSPVTTTNTSSGSSPQNSNNPGGGSGSTASGTVQLASPIIENGLPTSSSTQDVANFRSSTIRQNSSNLNASNFSNATSAQNSVLVRTSVADNRRSSHSPASSVYNSTQMFQQQSQPQVVMRRDVIEMNQSGSSKAS